MTIETKEKNFYVQPVCKVIEMDLQQMIAASGVSSQNNDPDDFGWGGNL